MNWLTNFVRPRLNKLIGDDNSNFKNKNKWQTCPKCSTMAYQKNLESQRFICIVCGYHFQMPIEKRLDMIFDNSEYDFLESKAVADDPLKFRDSLKYQDRLKKARQKTKHKDSILVSKGKIGGQKCIVISFNFAFMGGSLGSAAGEAFVHASKIAVATKSSLLTITSSGGARMQEGVISLMQLPRTIIALENIRNAKLPYIVLMTNPTMGGVTASVAMLGDVHLAEPKAVIGFAGRRVVSSTSQVELPDDYQTAEFLQKRGFVDQIVKRENQRDTISSFLSLLMNSKPSTVLLAKP